MPLNRMIREVYGPNQKFNESSQFDNGDGRLAGGYE